MENIKNMGDVKRSFEIKKSINSSSHSHITGGDRIHSNRSQRSKLKNRNDYLSTSNPTFTNLQRPPRDSNSSYSILKIPKRKWKENKMIPKPEPKRETKIIDYLMERRMKRERLESKGQSKKSRTPYLDIKNPTTDRNSNSKPILFNNRSMDNYGLSNTTHTIDPNEEKAQKIDKIIKIREKARIIEESVNRKEQLMKYQGGSIGENVSMNDMLIDAITAKLKILDNL